MRRLLFLSTPALWLLALLSVVVAALQFVVPLYMMAVYNRILQTQSLESLQLISFIALFLLIILGIAEMGRSRLLALVSKRVTSYLNKDVYEAILASPGSELGRTLNEKQPSGPRTQPLQDLRTVSGFLSQGGISTIFDAIFAPVFLVAMFVLHPLLGFIGIGAAVIIFSLAISAELLARKNVEDIGKIEASAQATLEQSLNQFDAVTAMGMTEPLYAQWNLARAEGALQTTWAQSLSGVLTNTAKSVRLIVQMAVLGVGAYLAVTTDYFLAGAIIAASIILGRGLAPIDQSIALWRPFVAARQASRRLVTLMDVMESVAVPFDLPKPKAELHADALTLLIPGQDTPLIQNASFHLAPGDILGIFGANGMGKTSLLQAVAGLVAPKRGVIALGTGAVTAMSGADRAKYMGYLPQDVQLLPGSIAENISRFQEVDKNALFTAVEMAGAEDLIQSLPLGFNTPLHEISLSSGQKQQLGLARAVYGDPVLLCMDEPTANLDAISRKRIALLLEDRREKGLLTVLVTHEDHVLAQCSHWLQMGARKRRGMVMFGTQAEVIHSLKADAKKGSAK